MGRLKMLAKRYLSESQLKLLRRWFFKWRGWWGSREDRRARKLGYTVSDLRHASRQLWAGHSKTASDQLWHILQTPGAPKSHRARAAFQLAKLFAANEEWAETDARLDAEMLGGLQGQDQARGHILKAVAAMQLGKIEVAEEALSHGSLARLGKNQQWLLQANLEYFRSLQPDSTTSLEKADALRLGYLNRIYRNAGLMEVAKRDPDRPLSLDNIGPRERVSVSGADNAKVSVLMPCFNAEQTIAFAIDSVLSQTHGNVEILCADDRSSDATRDIVQSYIDAGAPVTLLVNEQNSGPYRGRNNALAQASGDYVTVQDADDWMHPQRLEVQVAYLRKNPHLRFSFTRLARVAEGFLFTLRPFRPMLEPIHWNYTSILGSREAFVALGGWDPVVAHADAEFIDRIKEHWGEESIGEGYPEVPMALFSDGSGNLTKRAGTGLTSVGFGARREYQEQAKYWRQQGAPGLPGSGLIDRVSGREPFFVPNALLPPYLKRDSRYDFVFITDMSLLGGTRRCNLEYFRICVEQGWKVGVFNHPRYRGRKAGSIDWEYRRLFDRGEVDLLTPEDTVETNTVIVHHPPILDAPIDAYPTISTSTVGILVNQLPYQSTRPDATPFYDPSRVETDLCEAFGRVPVWIPISGLVRGELERFVSADRVLSDTWYPVVGGTLQQEADKAPQEEGDSHPDRPIRVGRHSRDHATKWPDTPAELRRVYPGARDMEVYILGGADTVCGGRVKLPKNWTVYAFDSIEVPTFLEGIDVFIHWTRSDYIEEFGRNVAEAMAYGVPCILSSDLKPTFGDAALYPAAEDVETTIRSLANDPQLRSELVAKGKAFVTENCSADVASDRMKRLLDWSVSSQGPGQELELTDWPAGNVSEEL